MSELKHNSAKTSSSSTHTQGHPSRGPSNKPYKKSAIFPIVGIGASAGGLEAMTHLLRHLPAQTGMAFVLVQHLDPTHESALSSLLSRLTEMPVSEVKNRTPLRPNNLYVIPPNKLMGLSQHKLTLSPRSESNMPIDEFLCTLAEQEGSRAIGVLLSGNGSDGTQGLLAIKSAGGITFAQEEKTAKYPGMPGSAITAGCVDFVQSPERIARELTRLAGHPYVTPRPEDETEAEGVQTTDKKTLAEILAILRQHTTVDFTNYKQATLHRRVERRMMLRKCETLQEYLQFLQSHPGEVLELYSDILIHVTGFFRDTAIFQTLKRKLFPRLLRNRTTDDPVRIWVPGCSTGEEAYSIAIALMEFMTDRKVHHPIQIFGTDIHDAALDKARAGAYPENISAKISGERLRRFFVRTEGGYRINKSIREMCVFARQNLVVDPPFSNLDLISCRNVLIYLGQPLQRKVLPLFHYALKSGGFLMLGASETVGGFPELFSLVDKKAKIFCKKSAQVRPTIMFGHAAPEPKPVGKGSRLPPVHSVGPTLSDVQRHADRIMLAHYSPAGVVINKDMEVLQFRGKTGLFLEHAHGEASLKLLSMVREGLVLDLRNAVTRAIKQGVRVRQRGISIKQNGHAMRIAIEVIPYSVPPSSERFFLVLFQPVKPVDEPMAKLPERRRKGRTADHQEMSRMREELSATRESLQSIIEEQEVTMEELRSANEEIMSSNEELQSTNEELETAKEELQSTNEELTTLNDELEGRNSELEHVNNDLLNVLGSVNFPILILGADLRIRRFTSVAERTFNLIPTDVGRPLTDINLPLQVPNLSKLVQEVIETLNPKEMEIQDRNHHWWWLRIRPYKTADMRIDGAILAMVDIDLLKMSARQLSEGRVLAGTLINAVRRPALLLDKSLSVHVANDAFYTAFHVSPEQTMNHLIYRLGGNQWDIPKLRILLEEIVPQNSSFKDFVVEFNFPRLGYRKMVLEGQRISLGEGSNHMVLLMIDDATEMPSR